MKGGGPCLTQDAAQRECERAQRKSPVHPERVTLIHPKVTSRGRPSVCTSPSQRPGNGRRSTRERTPDVEPLEAPVMEVHNSALGRRPASLPSVEEIPSVSGSDSWPERRRAGAVPAGLGSAVTAARLPRGAPAEPK